MSLSIKTGVMMVAVLNCLAAGIRAEMIRAEPWKGGSIQLDGNLDKPAWKQASVYHLHGQKNYEGGGVSTDFRVLYDENALFIGVVCQEPRMSAVKCLATHRDQGVYNDDDIEIFVDPTQTGERYYQFLFNTLGTQMDVEALEGGRVSSKLWDGDWQVKVHREDEFWSAEVMIPWSLFGGMFGKQPQLGFNLTRERYAGGSQELYSWATLERFNDVRSFGVLSNLNVDWEHFSVEVQPAKIGVEPANERWKLYPEAWLHIKSGSDGRFTVRLLDAEKRSRLASAVVAPSGNADFKVVLPPFEQERLGETAMALEVANSKGQLIASRRFVAQLAYKAMEIVLNSPSYRNTIYATEKVTQIEGVAQVNKQLLQRAAVNGVLLLKLLNDKEDALATATLKVKNAGDDRLPFSLPAESLAAGAYRLICRLVDANGGDLATVEVPVRKVAAPPAGNEVRVAANGNLLLNGSPFVPIGWYGVEWMGYVRHGFKFFPEAVNFFYNNRPAENDQIFEAGKYFALETPQPGKEWTERDDLSADMRTQLRNFIHQYAAHPGLIAWYLADEPEIWDVRPRYLEAYYQFMANEDPWHPCYVINDSVEGLKAFARCADIQCPDPYFLPGVEGSLDELRNFLQAAQPGAGDIKGKWVTLQAFGYNQGPELPKDDDGRCPTFIEARAMHLYSALHGACGWVDFIPQQAYSDAGLRIGMPYIQKELQWLTPFILAGPKSQFRVASDNPAVEVQGKKLGDMNVILAVNTVNSAQQSRLDFGNASGETAWKVMAENRALTPRKNQLEDSFEPFAAHIYCSDPDRGSELAAVQSIRSEIAAYKASHTPPRENVARLENIAAVRVSGQHYLTTVGLFDGILDGLGWANDEKRPAWLEITFKKEQNITRAVLFTPTIKRYEVQGWDGDQWISMGEGKVDNLQVGAPCLPQRSELPLTARRVLKVRIMVKEGQGEINELWLMDDSQKVME